MPHNSAVNSYDEWTQLREVIIGRVDGFSGFQFDSSFDLGCWENLKPFLASKDFFRDKDGMYRWPVVKIKAKIIQELNEDIENFVRALKGQGVVVRRPQNIVGNGKIKTPYWASIQSPPLNIRDLTIILGSTILETAPDTRARIFENDYLKPIFYEYMLHGARWLNMPRPTLSAGSIDTSFYSLSQEESVALQDHHALPLPQLGYEIIFAGAQCIRLGKDILVNVANKNHELGFQWLKSVFGDIFNFYRLDRLADCHIDSTILPLRPGLWLVRDPKVLEFLPDKFRNWDIIVAPERKETFKLSKEYDPLYLSSKYLDMNVLSINESTVVVNALNPELIEKLESEGFKVVPVQHRHGRIFGGGFHCFSLDICRKGKLESYI